MAADRTWYAKAVLVGAILLLLILEIANLAIVSQIYSKSQAASAATQSGIVKSDHISVTKDGFGNLANGKAVERYTIENKSGMKVQMITYGAIITSIRVPDRRQQFADVVLGFDNIQNYETRNDPYFGAVVGRVANRIRHGNFTLDGVTYQLNINNGPNHLHGGPKGWSKLLWKARPIEDGVVFTLVSPDGDEKYPGEVVTNVTYRLTEDNKLSIRFQAKNSKKPTPINLTSHSYFNLAGEGTASINDHEITIFADRYLKLDQELIPTGEISRVAETIFDLRTPKQLANVLPRFNGSGYDTNFCVRGPTGQRLVARAYHRLSGRMLEVYADQPGLQFYTGNFLDIINSGKEGHSYPKHSGFCFETQSYPDAVNHENFPDTILREGSTYGHWVSYEFSTDAQ